MSDIYRPNSDSERRIYLIRHGHASHRSSNQVQTSRGMVADPPLDQIGLDQADVLTRRLLKMRPPARILVSPLLRARQTIEPYEAITGCKADVVDDLAEWYAGDWEFKEFEELLVEHPEMPKRVLLQDPVLFLAPGGETMEDLRKRVVSTIRDAASDVDGDLWVVCHGGVINAYVGTVLGIGYQEMFYLPPNTSINTVLLSEQGERVWFLADDTHLTQPDLYADEFHEHTSWSDEDEEDSDAAPAPQSVGSAAEPE